MQRTIRWITREGGGIEHVSIAAGQDAIVAEGVVVGPVSGPMAPGAPFGCSYLLRLDARWRVRHLALRVAGGARLLLRADGEGRWSGVNGDPLPALEGCIDVDLTCTPLTNTLPIRRLGPALAQRHEITVAYVTLPGASVMPSRQAYTALDAVRYRFESLSDPFQADIVVDADGLVLDYPGLFTRA